MAANRRRGNAQSASSSRAADLLGTQGHPIGFAGFGQSSNIFLQDQPSFELDAEIRAAFAKLTKKDRKTREGALESLSKLLPVKDEGEVLPTFSHFAANYSSFVTDSSTTFRVEANNVLKLYISKLQKSIKNELKQILPFLLFSIYDVQNSVKKSGEVVLAECFGEEKVKQIRRVFNPELVTIVMEIIKRTHKLMQPQKFTDDEEDVDRGNRLIAQSLNALNALGELADQALVQEISSNSSMISQLLSLPENVKTSLFSLFARIPRHSSTRRSRRRFSLLWITTVPLFPGTPSNALCFWPKPISSTKRSAGEGRDTEVCSDD
ncbi:hypothetical protein L596_006830 [Steinernema carpocapsae]|uniref:E3 ubiquitin-protein ligase listerin n=1 Tax=Steinernema carpocapsae TaxID=34508 RepID=A0A4U5P753_STECR|nr:hypothetical protein L596_006830 [Steinernema carpocapsae]